MAAGSLPALGVVAGPRTALFVRKTPSGGRHPPAETLRTNKVVAGARTALLFPLVRSTAHALRKRRPGAGIHLQRHFEQPRWSRAPRPRCCFHFGGRGTPDRAAVSALVVAGPRTALFPSVRFTPEAPDRLPRNARAIHPRRRPSLPALDSRGYNSSTRPPPSDFEGGDRNIRAAILCGGAWPQGSSTLQRSRSFSCPEETPGLRDSDPA